MNILVLGTDIIEQEIIKLSQKSKLLDHLYTASNAPLDSIPNIEYRTLEELVKKSKALQIDLVLVADKNFIHDGTVDFLKKNLLNVISVNQKWFNLEYSRLVAKQLAAHYSINTPEIIKAPMVFPIVIKTDFPGMTKVVRTMNELVEVVESLDGERTFLEEYLEGEVFYLLSLWDGENLLTFSFDENLTEVQQDRLDLYKTKLSFMLSDEKADFIGFFTTKLIWSKNDWYILEYIMHLNEKSNLKSIRSDLLYVLNSAIYQKLNEIKY